MIQPFFNAVLAIAVALSPTGSGISAGKTKADRGARQTWLNATLIRRNSVGLRLRTAETPSLADVAAVLQSQPAAGKAGAGQIPRNQANRESGPPPSVPPCQTYSENASEMAVISSSAMLGLTYVDEPIEQIEKMVPHLNPIGLDATHDADAHVILGDTGAAVAGMVERMPNLIATEKIREPVETLGFKSYETRIFNYAIVRSQKPTSGLPFVEFRTDARGQSIDYSPDSRNRPLGVGFATMWLIFTPGKLHESRFRYLGQQSIDGRKTYVLAFAQNPEKTGLRVVINYPSGQCSTPLQGVAWIDEATFQIVRMQTDLLSPVPYIQLYQLRSVLTYSSVKIAGLKLSLWLPRHVETRWQSGSQVGVEYHRYSHYRLFKAKVKILPGFKRLRK